MRMDKTMKRGQEIVLTIRYREQPANARGMATEVILSYGPFKYVCL